VAGHDVQIGGFRYDHSREQLLDARSRFLLKL
jgi:hypothetical protein